MSDARKTSGAGQTWYQSGFEIAEIVGFILENAVARTPVGIDGVVS